MRNRTSLEKRRVTKRTERTVNPADPTRIVVYSYEDGTTATECFGDLNINTPRCSMRLVLAGNWHTDPYGRGALDADRRAGVEPLC